jgi:hypothetical protein
MKRPLLLLVALTLVSGAGRLIAAEPQLAHMVFFTLADDTKANREALVAACTKYLKGHDGVLYYSSGSIADDLQREVNDQEFDVALHLVFTNKAAHDNIEKNKHLWSKVRVFDSYVPAAGQ